MCDRPKNLSILGSTGSIGRQALELVQSNPDQYNVVGLSAGSNAELLSEQVRRFEPLVVGLADESGGRHLTDQVASESFSDSPPDVSLGEEAQERVAALPDADVVLSAVTGKAGLPGTVAGLRAGKRVALANKESLLIAGSLIRDLEERHDAELLPVDSEHSSLFQLLNRTPGDDVRTLILTASGGPFRTWDRERISGASVEDALNHPTWNMGDKITVDSATLMNKAIEVVEARHLFPFSPDQIRVVVHPQSRIHAMIELTDGTRMTHMGPPDMKAPIQYAFTYPERRSLPEESSDDLTEGPDLQFEAPRRDVFPGLDLGFYVARKGGTTGAVLNGANEVAVEAFLNGQIDFPMISEVVRSVLENHQIGCVDDLETVLSAERDARGDARRLIESTPPEMNSVTQEINET